MLFSSVAVLATLSLVDVAISSEVHGQSAKGTTMGAAAFMWPSVSVPRLKIENFETDILAGSSMEC